MKNESGFTPLDTRVLLVLEKVEAKTQGGIYLPDKHVERLEWAETKATIVAVGANAFMDWGNEAAKPIAGQSVIVAKYKPQKHEGLDGKDYYICNDEDIIAILETENV